MSSVAALEADSGEFPREASTDEGELLSWRQSFLQAWNEKGIALRLFGIYEKGVVCVIALLPPQCATALRFP